MSALKSKNYFLSWFQQNGNFLSKPLTTEEWDQKTSDPQIQKAIKKDKQARSVYAYLDGKMVLGHARLVDYIITEAIHKLNLSDFDNPAGFSRIEKGSPRVKEFFKVRQNLEAFIRNDIAQYDDKAAQGQAFVRWLATVEKLRQQRCYEGVNVVLGALIQVDIQERIAKYLPITHQRHFADLEKLISPDKSFSALRADLAKKQTPHDLPCIFMWVRDLTGFDEFLGENQNEIGPNDQRYKTLQSKKSMLAGIMAAAARPLPYLSSQLKSLYEKIMPKKDELVQGVEAKAQNDCNIGPSVLPEKVSPPAKGLPVQGAEAVVQENCVPSAPPKKDSTSAKCFIGGAPSFWQQEIPKGTAVGEGIISRCSSSISC